MDENKFLAIVLCIACVVALGLTMIAPSHHYNIFYLQQEAEKQDTITHMVNNYKR